MVKVDNWLRSRTATQPIVVVSLNQAGIYDACPDRLRSLLFCLNRRQPSSGSPPEHSSSPFRELLSVTDLSLNPRVFPSRLCERPAFLSSHTRINKEQTRHSSMKTMPHILSKARD